MSEITALRLASVPFRIRARIKTTIQRHATDIILRRIFQMGYSYGMTDRQLHKVSIKPYQWTGIDISIRYYGSLRGNKPVQRWYVAPIRKLALHWISHGRSFFSRGHWVKGVDARYVFEAATRQSLPRFAEAMRNDIQKFLEATSLR